MAIYSTFFLCTPAELPAGFPGWQPPLDQPIVRQVENPFTGETMTIESREPEWGDFGEEEAELVFQVVEIEGSYEDYLEQRLPSFVRDQSHWAAKNLTSIEMDPLVELVGLEVCLEHTLYAPPSLGASLQEFPVEFLPSLRELEDSQIEELAVRWAEALSSEEYTHSVSGEQIEEGWTTDEAGSVLGRIFMLALAAAADEQRLYLLVEA